LVSVSVRSAEEGAEQRFAEDRLIDVGLYEIKLLEYPRSDMNSKDEEFLTSEGFGFETLASCLGFSV
jgi:hypothetical protein